MPGIYKYKLANLALFAVMMFGAIVIANAQEAAERGVLEEIIVTAEKRSANIQDVAIPISAFSASDLIDANFVDLYDLHNMVPGISIGGSGVLQTQVALRGLAPPNAGIGQEEPVALYVDDVYIGRLSDNYRNAMLAADQIQVLRGPQGSLYGRNAVGGAIVVTTRQPTEDAAAEIRMRVGNYDARELSAIVSGPLSDRLYGLVAAKFDERRKGFHRNLADNRWTGGIKDETSYRGVLRFVPSDELEVKLIADYAQYDGSGNGPARNILDYENFPGSTTDDADPNDVYWDEFYAWPSGDEGQNDLTSVLMMEGYDYLAANGLPSTLMHTATGADIERRGVALVIKYDFANMQLTSVTSQRYNDNESTIDSYSRRHPAISNMELNDQEQFAQELRLASTGDGRMEWLVGLSYFGEEVKQLNIFRRVYCTDATGALLGAYSGQADCRDSNLEWGVLPYNAPRLRSPTIDVTSLALFGQATYSFTDRFRAIFGLRWSDEEKDWTLFFKNFTTPIASAVNLAATDSWDAVSPKVGIQFDATDNAMIYATVAEGFKSGGFNALSTSPVGETVEPETSTQFEIGVKTDLAGGRARINVAAFFNDYTDLQLRVVCPPTTICAGSTALINASAAEITGAEVEFSALVTDNFTVSGFLNYLDAEFTDYVPSPTENFTGHKLPRAPEFQYSLSGNYTADLGNGGEISLIGSYRYSDSEFFRANNTALDENKSNDYVSARAAYRSPNASWEVAIFGNNLTDEHYRNNGFQLGSNSVAAFYNPPRTYGIEFIWRTQD